MTYFADLSPYTYIPGDENAVTVGWLALGHPFPQGDVPGVFLDRLWVFCRGARIMATRGVHACEFCLQESYPLWAERDGEGCYLGSAEIRVFGAEGQVFAAPNLIYHYVTAHRYLPPAAFVEAAMSGPLPHEPAYAALARECPWYPDLQDC